MANIATIMTVAIQKANCSDNKVNVRKILQALTKSYGRTYCVPTWQYKNSLSGCLYTQHGERWGTSGPTEVWNLYQSYLEAIWVRCYNDGGDHDVIFRIPGLYDIKSQTKAKWCQYGFDEVRITMPEDLGSQLDKQWDRTPSNTWIYRTFGSYLAGNNRSDVCGGLSILSPTTPVRAKTIRARKTSKREPNLLYWHADQMPTYLSQLEEKLFFQASRIEFHWRGRLTRLYQRQDDFWRQWNLDDWDNCVNEGWIAEDPACLCQNETILFGRAKQLTGQILDEEI